MGDEPGPWSFDNIMLVLATILQRESPTKVPLISINIWIQVHDLPSGFMNETVAESWLTFLKNFLCMVIRMIVVCGGIVCELKLS